jgi:DTW domain-containing protein
MIKSSNAESGHSFRSVCERCRRPTVVCYCAHIPTLPTRTKIVLLQHPRERRMGIGTAHMAHLALPNSIVRVAYDFARDPVVQAILTERSPSPVAVLFPGPDARDVATLPPGEPLTLIVIDGTWSQARSLLRSNPALAALPRVAFAPRKPSDYRIRRQPAEFCVSTIEALAEVLSILEPPGLSFDRLLDPFRAMVKQQEYFATEVRSRRHQAFAAARALEGPPRFDARLRNLWSRIVCVQGEANAWPISEPSRPRPEIIHWTAYRPATGETYEAIVSPREPLGPATPLHVGLSAEQIMGGVDIDTWRKSWQDFRKDDDILLAWGLYYAGVAQEDGLFLGDAKVADNSDIIDVRAEITRYLQARVGTVDRCLERLEGSPVLLDVCGRAGRRLSALGGVVRSVCELSKWSCSK